MIRLLKPVVLLALLQSYCVSEVFALPPANGIAEAAVRSAIERMGGEQMLIMVYFPEHKLLYGSDLVQPQRDGSFFMPDYLLELMESVRREKLTVTGVFAMHSGVRPWAEIEAAVEKVKSAPRH